MLVYASTNFIFGEKGGKVMFLKFKVKNYKSIGEEAGIDMVAGSGSDNKHFLFIEKNNVKILPMLAIFGVNVSGKTNLIEALCNMCLDIKDSYKNGFNDLMRVNPNLFNGELREQPTEYEMCLAIKDKEYRYGYAANKEEIKKEWLYVRKLSMNETKWQNVFDREENSISFCDKYRSLDNFSAIFTNNNNMLVLSFLGAKQDKKLQVFADIYKWIFSTCMSFDSPNLKAYAENEDLKEEFTKFIGEIDPSITGITANNEDIRVMRKSGEYPLEIESSGIKKLFACYSVIYSHLKLERGLFVADDFDWHLHSTVIKRIASMYHDSNENTKGSQLIGSYHNLILLVDNKGIRRDEIVLAKNSEFNNLGNIVRADMNYEKNLLDGTIDEIMTLKHTYSKK